MVDTLICHLRRYPVTTPSRCGTVVVSVCTVESATPGLGADPKLGANPKLGAKGLALSVGNEHGGDSGAIAGAEEQKEYWFTFHSWGKKVQVTTTTKNS